MKKRITYMFWLFAALFAVMAGYFVYVAAFEADDFIANPFNARVRVYDTTVRRGGIYDARGEAINESVLAADGYFVRQYPFGAIFAHTAGYSQMGRAGLELSRNFAMYDLRWGLFQRARHAILGTAPEGNSVVTTLDAGLQEMTTTALGNSRGAVVVLDPATGAVLAMVSTPSFDPTYIGRDWAALRADAASPLLNRATQGLYPPGSTFKVITAAAALSYDAELINFTFHCHGRAVFGVNTLGCWGDTAHGEVDMRRAMAVSCNGYFAALAEFIGAGAITNAANAALFNTVIDFELPVAAALFPMQADAAQSELIETAIGQGRTTATPLNMAVIAAAIANNGVAMNPFVVDRIISPSGASISTTSPATIGWLMDADVANLIAEMMAEAVNSGTGTPAALPNIQTAGKTGTAQNETGIDHSWFIGHAPADNPQVALAIVIENTGGGTRASSLAARIFAHVLE